VAGFFLFLRYVDYVVRRDQKGSLAKLASLTCFVCGAAFGPDVAEAAKLAGEKRIAKLMAEAQQRRLGHAASPQGLAKPTDILYRRPVTFWSLAHQRSTTPLLPGQAEVRP